MFPPPVNGGYGSDVASAKPISRKKRRESNESRMDGFDVNRHDDFDERQLKNGVPAVFDQHRLFASSSLLVAYSQR